MKNEIENLRTYLSEVKMLIHHGSSKVSLIVGYSEKAITQLKFVEQKMTDKKHISVCQRCVTGLKSANESLSKYKNDESDNSLTFINDANQVYNGVDYFLDYFDDLN